MKTFETVIFDLGGILVDWNQSNIRAYYEQFGKELK